MNFSEEIKEIRKKEHLTQQQLADDLNVTRQAVSNWENDKNYPDINILILISEKYNISLDKLIKDKDITQKLVLDTSLNKRSKYNMVSSIIGLVLILLGILLIVIKALSVEYVDENGILHENFFLIVIGFVCILSGLISFISIGIKTIVDRLKDKKNQI